MPKILAHYIRKPILAPLPFSRNYTLFDSKKLIFAAPLLVEKPEGFWFI